jgi:hypothetical protein
VGVFSVQVSQSVLAMKQEGGTKGCMEMKKTLLLICLMVMVCPALPVQAASVASVGSISFLLDDVLPNHTDPGDGPWLTMSFETVPNNQIKLTLTGSMSGNEKISDVYFNCSNEVNNVSFETDPNDGSTIDLSQNKQQMDGYTDGYFDVLLKLPVPNNNAFKDHQTRTFYINITGADADVSLFDETDSGGNWYAGAHLQGLSGNENSTFIVDKTPPGAVPLPAAGLLFGSGVVPLFWLRRRLSAK